MLSPSSKYNGASSIEFPPMAFVEGGNGLIGVVSTLVIWPNEFTVTTGIVIELPYVPAIAPEDARLTERNPSEVIGVELTDNVEEAKPTEVTVPIPLPGVPMLKFEADVILPSSPMVICGTEELLPYTPVVTPVGAVSTVMFPLVVLGELVTVKLDERIPTEVNP